jgi:hypothetical protein
LYAGVNNFLLSDQAGKQLANTVRPYGEPLPDLADSEQIHQVFATGKPVVFDVFTGGVLRRPKVAIDVPVWRNGKVVYSLGVGFLPERLGKILTEQRLPANRIVAIFDTKGVIAARTHEPDEFVGQKGPPVLLEHMRETNEGDVEVNRVQIPFCYRVPHSCMTGGT